MHLYIHVLHAAIYVTAVVDKISKCFTFHSRRVVMMFTVFYKSRGQGQGQGRAVYKGDISTHQVSPMPSPRVYVLHGSLILLFTPPLVSFLFLLKRLDLCTYNNYVYIATSRSHACIVGTDTHIIIMQGLRRMFFGFRRWLLSI